MAIRFWLLQQFSFWQFHDSLKPHSDEAFIENVIKASFQGAARRRIICNQFCNIKYLTAYKQGYVDAYLLRKACAFIQKNAYE